MTPRILIPTEDMDGKHVAQHFGRAAYFVIVDITESGRAGPPEVHANTGSHRGGSGHAHDNVMQYNPNVIIVMGMGPRGIGRFQDANIAVLKADSMSVDSVFDSYIMGRLVELTEGCDDAHHK